MRALRSRFDRAAAAAASLSSRRFGLLVASSLVATSAVIAAAMTGTNGLGPLAGLIDRSLAADRTSAPSTPAAPERATAPSGPAGPAEPAPAPSPPAPLRAPEAIPASEPEAPAPPPESPLPEAGPIQHVFVISLSSPGYEAAFGSTPQMPYLASTLRPKGVLLSGYSLLGEAALANSIAAVSGQPPNPDTSADCPTYTEFPSSAKANASGVVAGNGCVYPVETLTLADQLGSARLSWRAYIGGMADETGKPANCAHPEPDTAEAPAPGAYSSRLNPFVHFHSLLDLGDCASNDVPLTGLDKDLRKVTTTPSYSYISPDPCAAGIAGQCEPGATEGAAAADAFLAELTPKILASPAYKQDGLLIVTFGGVTPVSAQPATSAEPASAAPAESTPTAPEATSELKVGTLLISRFVTPGSTDAAAYNPYSLLRSTEDLFGLSHLARASGAKVKSFAPAPLGESGGD